LRDEGKRAGTAKGEDSEERVFRAGEGGEGAGEGKEEEGWEGDVMGAAVEGEGGNFSEEIGKGEEGLFCGFQGGEVYDIWRTAIDNRLLKGT